MHSRLPILVVWRGYVGIGATRSSWMADGNWYVVLLVSNGEELCVVAPMWKHLRAARWLWDYEEVLNPAQYSFSAILRIVTNWWNWRSKRYVSIGRRWPLIIGHICTTDIFWHVNKYSPWTELLFHDIVVPSYVDEKAGSYQWIVTKSKIRTTVVLAVKN